jgi:hypothetical protein
MPNSRIETSGLWSKKQLELFDIWTTDGNALISGGGNVLGSTDNYPFFFITNGLKRAGFNEAGEFLLCDYLATPETYLKEKVKKIETQSDEEVIPFSIYVPDDTLINFSVKMIYLNKDGSNYGTIARDITCLRKGSTIIFTGETNIITERIGNKSTSLFFRQNVNAVEIVIKGITGLSLKWSSQLKYQGITNY